MFPADADTNPYPKSRNIAAIPADAARQAPPAITHANTRLPDEEEVGPASGTKSGSRLGSSPARSWVDAAVKGTPCKARPHMEAVLM
jgi:protein DGCR14